MAAPALLLATETTDLAADLVALELEARGMPFLRVNLDRFPTESTVAWSGERGVVSEAGRIADLFSFSAGWFRRLPSLPETTSSAAAFVASQVEATLQGVLISLPLRWMNRPSALPMAELKIRQLQVANSVGFRMPETLVTNDPRAARSFAAARPIVGKAIAGGTLRDGEAHFAVFTQDLQPSALDDEEALQACPLILQHRVERLRDVRITVVGDVAFGAAIRVLDDSEVDWRAVDPKRVRYEPLAVPGDIANGCTGMLQRLDLSYGAFDFILTPQEDLVFLELNPSGQWGWLERVLDLPITATIVDTLVEWCNSDG